MDDDEIAEWWAMREREGLGIRERAPQRHVVEVLTFRCGCGQELAGDAEECPRCGQCFGCG